MARVVFEDTGRFNQQYPKPAAIITAQAGGKKNAMAAAWLRDSHSQNMVNLRAHR